MRYIKSASWIYLINVTDLLERLINQVMLKGIELNLDNLGVYEDTETATLDIPKKGKDKIYFYKLSAIASNTY